MSRAKDLFDRLRSGRKIVLDQLIADREMESLFLDFKRSKDNGTCRRLEEDDNKNLAKAISGFGNSSGGVVIWGVDCRRDEKGHEVASRHPLIDAAGFATKVQSAISRVTVPPHPGVEVEFFQDSEESSAGYVVVLIPQSHIGPLRSVVSNHYHLRAGSDFNIVPHDVLAGMFGRPPLPSIDLNLVSYPARIEGHSDKFILAFGAVAVNLGVVICERPYISMFYGDLPRNCIIVRALDLESYATRRGVLPTASVVSKAGIILPPGGAEHLCDVVIEIPVDQPRSIDLECTLGSSGSLPRRFTLAASQEALQNAIARARHGALSSTDILQLNPLS